MRLKTYPLTFCVIFFASCNNSTIQNRTIDTTTHTTKVTDSAKAKLINALNDIIKSNASIGDTTINGRYVNQGKYNNGDFYITIKTIDSTITLINLSLLKDDEISRLKKNGDNISVTYNQSNKTIKFLSTQNEPEK